VFTAKHAPSGIRFGATWRSLLMILLTSAFCCVVCSLLTLPNSACACVRNVVWFNAASISCINVSLSVGPPPSCDVLLDYVDPVVLHRLLMMMMIPVITINSGLVPSIEGLCAQIYYFRFEIISIEGLCAQIYNFRFEIIGGLRSHLLLFFFGRKNMLKKKTVSPRSHPAS